MIRENLLVDIIPAIPGFQFRKFAGPSDYPAMVDVINSGHVADHIEEIVTVEVLASDSRT